MTRLRLTLLGDFQARLGPGPPLRLRARKTQALLAYLALPAGRLHSRDKLAAVLWGDRSPHHARSRLRETLFVLRRALAPADPCCLTVGAETVGLEADAVDVDAVVFERLVEKGDTEALGAAVDLYGGDLLEGFDFRGSLFEDWLMAERERLRELALDALAKLLANQRSAGLVEPALKTALRLIGLDPLQEAVHRTLMRLYTDLGRRGAALRQYQLCVGVLRRELGVEPEADTRTLYLEILRHRGGTGTPGGTRWLQAGSSPGTLATQPLTIPTDIPLVGREQEMARSRTALVEAHAGRGRIMLVTGEAGVGKTRLIGELSAEASHRDSHVLLGRCHEGEQILPFGPWVDALRAGRIPERIGGLADLSPASRSELARLLPELDAGAADRGPPDYLKVFESVAQLLVCLGGARPLLLILEDLHWADEMSIRLLAFIGRRIASWPAIVVMTARQDELVDAPMLRRTLQDLSRAPHVVHLELAPLARPETVRLVRTLARSGRDEVALARLTEQVWSTSEGNPFVVVETTRALEEGTIVADSTARPLPRNVRELIAGRLERLSDRARDLASAAAVFARAVDFPLLQRAGGLDEHTTAEALEELVRRHVLGGVGEGFDFSHDRVRAVVYDQLLPPQRTLRHRRAGEALEALHAGNLGPYLLALGVHFREGQVWDRAVDFFRRAGEYASARSASSAAVACFNQALGALEHLPENPDTIRLAIDLRRDLQSGYLLLGELPRMLDSLREAERLATVLGDAHRLARVWAHMSASCWWMGQLETAVDYALQALATARSLGDFGLEILAGVRLGLNYLYLGEYRQAIEILQPYMEALSSGDLVRERFEMASLPAVSGRVYLSASLVSLGDFTAAARAAEEALAIAVAADHPYSVAHAWNGLGRRSAMQGNFREAIPWLERSLDACRKENFYFFSIAAVITGTTYVRAGRVADGIALFEEAADHEATTGFALYRPGRLAALAEAYLLSGRVDEALQTARLALDLSRAGKQRGYEADTLHLLGEIHARLGAPDSLKAAALFQEALALAGELGMRPLVARCHLGLGRLYRQAGQSAAAKEHLGTAGAMLAQMEMRFWLELEQAEAELSLG